MEKYMYGEVYVIVEGVLTRYFVVLLSPLYNHDLSISFISFSLFESAAVILNITNLLFRQ